MKTHLQAAPKLLAECDGQQSGNYAILHQEAAAARGSSWVLERRNGPRSGYAKLTTMMKRK